MISAYSTMIDKAHAKGIRAYGAPILPFAKSFYNKDFRQAARDTVNAWIRNSGLFDAVIDFDKLMRNPDDIRSLLPDLHTNEAAYWEMGEFIDLKLFENRTIR